MAGVERVRVLVLVVGVCVVVTLSRTVGATVTITDSTVSILLLRQPLWRSADVQNLSVVTFPSLTFPQFPGFGLDSDEEEEKR